MQVTFDYDRGAEYKVILSDEGEFEYVVVEYEDYDLYFGE